jgi:hypothetical protein
MAISTVLMVGMVQMFKSNRTAFSLMEQLQLVEENGRVGIDFIATDLASAYYPSAGGDNSDGPLTVYDNVVAPTDEDNMRANLNVLPGTDIIEVFTTSCDEEINFDSLSNVSATTPFFNESSLAGCMDCYYANMSTNDFKLCTEEYTILLKGVSSPADGRCTYNLTSGTNPNGPKIKLGYNRGNTDEARNLPHSCANLFAVGNNLPGVGIIGELIYYYVRADDPANTSGTPNPQLMRYVFGGTAEVLANYAEDFQILIGEDDDRDGRLDTWASGVIDQNDVRVVKISLMLKTPNINRNKAMQSPQEFADLAALENSTIANLGTADRNRRRLVTRSIRLRNMEDAE